MAIKESTEPMSASESGRAQSSSQSQYKISSLTQLLESGSSHAKENISGWGDVRTLAPQLFRRATEEFLEERSLDELSVIVQASFERLRRWLELRKSNSATAPYVECLPGLIGDRPSFVMVLEDRPFIINTIVSCTRAHHLSVSAFLHPIVKTPQGAISLSYLEVDPTSVSVLAVFEEEIRKNLSQLSAATDDFAAMKTEATQCAAHLEQTSPTLNEDTAFLKWLQEDRFVFEGYAKWSIEASAHNEKNLGQLLGIFRADSKQLAPLIEECHEDVLRAREQKKHIYISRLRILSPIHHRERLSHIVVVEKTTKGATTAHSFVGQFTSKALVEEASGIPHVSTKARNVLEREGLRTNSHLYKTVLTIIDTMPKHGALIISPEVLQQQIRLLLEVQSKNDRRALITVDESQRGAWVLITMPAEHFDAHIRSKLEQKLQQAFHVETRLMDFHVAGLDESLCRIYFYVPIVNSNLATLDIRAVENDLVTLTKGWETQLHEAIIRTFEESPSLLSRRYRRAFGGDYQSVYQPNDSIEDIKLIESLSKERPLRVSMSNNVTGSPHAGWQLTIAQRAKELTLSYSLHILEHAGFEVLHEQSFVIRPNEEEPVYLYRFPVRIRGASAAPLEIANTTQITEGLEKVLLGKQVDDALNALLLRAGLDVHAISLLRSLTLLLWQMRKFATRATIREALVENPTAAKALWDLWRLKFDPAVELDIESRKKRFTQELDAFRQSLNNVTDITADRILRYLASILECTVRTNFFHPRTFRGEQVVAMKISSEQLDMLVAPRPLFEIFMCCSAFEGVHLRSAKVARGGIRWSDRRDDYRSEVRDLMKTQQVKNALIVPSGAKGGFVVKDLPSERAAQGEMVQNCYKEFIRGLLSLTDNLIDGKVVRPKGLVIYDPEDTYLVVAADKGTATFSDTANAIATQEFNFWLGDAFASGGSNGYDHKKFGVTARGAWEAVKQHFHQLGIDYQHQPFTVSGIGDMSGDVFGNGLLLSNNMKLVAAFNHKHIFIDPTPDALTSFEERKRLFTMPFSQWSDYRTELLSRGGAIYDRNQKEIIISTEARTALALPADAPKALSGDQLVVYILKAPVDLLWNGGIGTYVKSRSESDADVNDATNDRVRINAEELRAKVVAEGGNLGFTQLGRIDFARRGGYINTDAIDNSGGVDTSDHEVNLKILFNSIIRQGKLDIAGRNALLSSMATAVVDAVLAHNRAQATLLAFAVKRSARNIDYFRSLISELIKRNYINRQVHFLPSDDELQERAKNKQGLTRPELAICLAGTKMWTKDELLSSGLTKQPLLREALVEYFPPQLAQKYREDMLQHPLADNIVATEVANELIETVGLTFVHRMCTSRTAAPATVLTALLAAKALLKVKEYRNEVKKFDTFAHYQIFFELSLELSAGLREATSWLLSNHSASLSSRDLVALYQEGLQLLLTKPHELLNGQLLDYCQQQIPTYVQRGLSQASAIALVTYPMMPLLFEILWTAQQSKVSVAEAAHAFCSTHDALGLLPVLTAQRKVNVGNKWEHELRLNAYEEIRRSIATLSCALIARGVTKKTDIESLLLQTPGYDTLKAMRTELVDRTPEVAMLGVFARQLRLFHIGQ